MQSQTENSRHFLEMDVVHFCGSIPVCILGVLLADFRLEMLWIPDGWPAFSSGSDSGWAR